MEWYLRLPYPSESALPAIFPLPFQFTLPSARDGGQEPELSLTGCIPGAAETDFLILRDMHEFVGQEGRGGGLTFTAGADETSATTKR